MIVRRVSARVLVANIVPSAVFYGFLRAGSVWAALTGAFVWCAAATAWQLKHGQPMSALLQLAMVGLVAKTAIALATGDAALYFVLPIVSDGLVAGWFLRSLLVGRPVVARLANEFFPLEPEVAERPRVRRLFAQLTMFWAIVTIAKGAVVIWLLVSLPLTTFVAARSVFLTCVLATAAGVTVICATKVARYEGLLHVAA